MNLPKLVIDNSWSLFLDRDGVLNRRIVGDYVRDVSQFEILPGVLESIAFFSARFAKIMVVTNQQGIGKGLMSHEDLNSIHQHFLQKAIQAGGRIDAFYYAPNLASENSPMRKPQIGMALQAQVAFPLIDFSKSIMIGDSKSDMQFGKNAGMTTIFIGEKQEEIAPFSDYTVSTLADCQHFF